MLVFITHEKSAISTISPITTAFVIVKNSMGFMLLYNKYRKLWELTGGIVEKGETPEECVIRECFEESGKQIKQPMFLGILKFYPGTIDKTRTEYSALYYTELNNIAEFSENDEIKYLS